MPVELDLHKDILMPTCPFCCSMAATAQCAERRHWLAFRTRELALDACFDGG